MTNWVATIFLLGFIAIWSTFGILMLARTIWLGVVPDITEKFTMPSASVQRTLVDYAKFNGYLFIFSRLCVRLLS
ncbi:MAG: hypothetical protein K1Y36_19590 [Blastocatellia bacterium]|nr:hypothetical protein [Blastocatellia bacterium]